MTNSLPTWYPRIQVLFKTAQKNHGLSPTALGNSFGSVGVLSCAGAAAASEEWLAGGVKVSMEVSMWLSICFKPMDLMRSNVSSVNLVSNVLTVFHFLVRTMRNTYLAWWLGPWKICVSAVIIITVVSFQRIFETANQWWLLSLKSMQYIHSMHPSFFHTTSPSYW